MHSEVENLVFSPCDIFTDEEKLDERAKMSVAAKRSLFRVHAYFYAFKQMID